MRSQMRRAAVNKVLLVIFGVVAVGAAVYWIFLRPTTDKAVEQAISQETRTLLCSKCGHVTVNGTEARSLERDAKSGKLKCPKCGEFKAQWPGSTGMKPPGT